MQFSVHVPIVKSDKQLRVVYGWASVSHSDGQAIIDHQGDMIDTTELVKAAQQFMQESRASKAMHRGDVIGEVVESMVMTPDIQHALGIQLDRVGWYIGIKIHDNDVWQKLQQGDYRQFSIGGRAKRVQHI